MRRILILLACFVGFLFTWWATAALLDLMFASFDLEITPLALGMGFGLSAGLLAFVRGVVEREDWWR